VHTRPACLHQQREQRVFLARERTARRADALRARQVDVQTPSSYTGGASPASRAAQQRAHARHQLLHAEGFGDVVVGAASSAATFSLRPRAP
jgi:hypothetical protein